MDEPVKESIREAGTHKQVKAACISMGMAVITVGLVVLICFMMLVPKAETDSAQQPSEVYILKDEVVDTGYLRSTVSFH